jgi:GNAT superfamily N-acetyltransferase
MPFREARAEDLPEIAALIRELADYERAVESATATLDDLGRHLFGPDPAARVLLATPAGQSDTIAGFALYYRTFSTWVGRPGLWLEDLFVRPQYRRLGLGRELLNELRRRSEDRLEWAVLDWNQPAIDFYRSLGAHPLDEWTIFRWLPGGPPVSAGDH